MGKTERDFLEREVKGAVNTDLQLAEGKILRNSCEKGKRTIAFG